MPSRKLRTRSLKRHVVRLPGGGGYTVHYAGARAKVSKCYRCGQILAGIRVKPPKELSRLPRSKKGPQRAFRGQLCHKCLQELLKQAVRGTIPQ